MKNHIHFIGIGGIGMSGVARLFKAQGYLVSGCDNTHNIQTKQLSSLGCKIYTPNASPCCFDKTITHYVYSSSISRNHPERVYAEKNNIPLLHRAQALHKAVAHQKTLCIAGTHGKTTTSSMLAHILYTLNTHPTIVVGGILGTITANAHQGTGPYAVVEADESDKSFLHLHPYCAAITNIEHEHHETFPTLKHLQNTCMQFLQRVPKHGSIILNADDPHSKKLINTHKYQAPITTIGMTKKADFQAYNITSNPNTQTTTCSIMHQGTTYQATIPMLGIHNVYNALVALAMCVKTGYSMKLAITSLHSFPGVHQRFTYCGTASQGTKIYDDYAHHPTEIKHALATARQITSGKLYVVFQPQRYSRTQHLWAEFIDALHSSDTDHLIITDIYAAHETTSNEAIHSKNLVRTLQEKNVHAEYIPADPSFSLLESHIHSLPCRSTDSILFLGAGKVQSLIPRLKNA